MSHPVIYGVPAFRDSSRVSLFFTCMCICTVPTVGSCICAVHVRFAKRSKRNRPGVKIRPLSLSRRMSHTQSTRSQQSKLELRVLCKAWIKDFTTQGLVPRGSNWVSL